MMQCFVSGKLTGNRTPTFPNSFVGSQGQWLTAVKGQAMAAGFMSSTVSQHLDVELWQGLPGRSHAGLPSPRLPVGSSIRLALSS